MPELLGVPLTLFLQGSILSTLLVIAGLLIRAWILGMPDRRRAANEGQVITNTEVALRFKEWRQEVHDLRNELAVVRAELHTSQNQSARRGDKLNMVLFIIRMVMDELAAKEPANKVLAQARQLLNRVEDEPHALDNSPALDAAEETRDAADKTVQAVKAEEAKQ